MTWAWLANYLMDLRTKLKDGSFGWRPRQLTTYECEIQPVLPIKISTATDMTGTASALGQGDVQQDVHLYSEDNFSGLVGTGLGGTGVNLSESQQIRENKKDLQ